MTTSGGARDCVEHSAAPWRAWPLSAALYGGFRTDSWHNHRLFIMQSIFRLASPQRALGRKHEFIGDAELKMDWTEPRTEPDVMGIYSSASIRGWLFVTRIVSMMKAWSGFDGAIAGFRNVSGGGKRTKSDRMYRWPHHGASEPRDPICDGLDCSAQVAFMRYPGLRTVPLVARCARR